MTSGTSIHLPMMVAAQEARDRCLAAQSAGRDVLTDAMVAVLLAAVALESGIYWVAEGIELRLREEVGQTNGLARKWAAVVEARDGVPPSLGRGLGQAIGRLGRDRDRIAHYPGRGRSTMSTPLARNRGQTATRAHFTAPLATESVSTAMEALHRIGVHWAQAGAATGVGAANDATVIAE